MLNHEVLDKVHKLMPYLRSQADEAERLGRLPEETAQRLKETGVVRLMQPRSTAATRRIRGSSSRRS